MNVRRWISEAGLPPMSDTTWLLIIFAAGIVIAEVGRFLNPYFNLYHNLSIILAVELVLMELVINS